MEQIVNESERREPMSQGDRSERIGFLRAAIARIEAGGAGAMGAAAGPGRAGPASAPEAADWAGAAAAARGLFCEVAPAAAQDYGAASGFALALAARCAREAGGPVAWIAEEFAFLEWGAPYGPGLAAYGLGWRELTLLRLPRRADVWLAAEEAIRARVFAAIVVEPAGLAGAEAPKILRRLAMGARAAGARRPEGWASRRETAPRRGQTTCRRARSGRPQRRRPFCPPRRWVSPGRLGRTTPIRG